MRAVRGWRDGIAACIYGYTVGYAYEVAKHVSQFPSFPNPHLRSNGFLMRRRSFQAFVQHVVVPRAKRDAFKLESGRSGLSRFVQMNGQRAVVVGRDGAVYEADEWGRSDTFRSPGHRNLLIADNQTSNYDMASVYSRRIMERSAWGRTFTQRAAEGIQ